MNSQSNTAALAQQQHDLLEAIFTANNIAIGATNTPARGAKHPLNSHSIRGLQTYQANAAASAQRSLQTAYPVIAQLIGDEAFAHLARDFWAQHPPTRGDLAQWGGELIGFIARIPALKTEPYLSDVAKAEWALHTAATAADQAADLATFALLTEHDPDALTLQLAPGTSLIHSEFPIASILTAHLYAAPSFEEVGQKLRQNTPETALVWRQSLRPMVALCTAAEAAFIAQLLVGASLLAALESDELVASNETFDFQLWLPQAVQKGLLLCVLPV
jgi:Putative DNA-binding domain